MIPAQWYSNIYFIIVTIITIIVTTKYRGYDNSRLNVHGTLNNSRMWLLPIFFTLFIGLRPISRVFVDMVNYNSFYYALAGRQPFVFDWNSRNYIFDNLFNWLASNHFAIEVFFFIIAAIYFFSAFIAIKKLFPRDVALAYIVFLAAFSTFSYATNGIKAGAAASIFLCALAYKDKLKICIPLLVASLGFHHSMIMPIVGFIICYFIKKTKFYLWVWFICLLFSIAHVTYFQILFAGMSDEDGATYLLGVDQAWGGKTGFRYDFVIYSSIPIVTGYYAIIRKRLCNNTAIFTVNLYTILNAIWMLCMYANFTNRIAYLSWFLYPIALIIPYLIEPIISKQYKIVNMIVWFQLIFTLILAYL